VDLDEPVQGLQELMADFLERLYKSTKQSENVSRGVLAMSVKIPITKIERLYYI
jgi:hypothetical protein